VNCAVVVGAILGSGVVTAIDRRVAGAGGGMGKLPPPPPPPHPVNIMAKIMVEIAAHILLCMRVSPFIINTL